MTKSELRSVFLAKRKALSTDAIFDCSRRISDHFFDNFTLDAVKILHCFVTIAKFREIDTSIIFERVWSDFPSIRTVVPRVNREIGAIESIAFSTDTLLIEDVWEIREPARAETLSPQEIDLALIPLLCFDKLGCRVGYGKGFYDRFLSQCRPDCLKIGLSFFPPIEKIDDVDKYDVPLDFCVTPDRVYTFFREAKKELGSVDV